MKLKYLALSVCAATFMSCNSDKPVAADPTLKDILGNKFLVGVAINSGTGCGSRHQRSRWYAVTSTPLWPKTA